MDCLAFPGLLVKPCPLLPQVLVLQEGPCTPLLTAHINMPVSKGLV